MDNFFLSNSPAETISIARKLSVEYENSLVLLYGTLGAGKTHFAKGFAEGLDITQTVTSPSYTIVNEYRAGDVVMYHIDLYRINCFEEVIDLGLFDILEAKQTCLIEWPDRVEDLQKLPHLEVKISYNSDDAENTRKLSWTWKNGA